MWVTSPVPELPTGVTHHTVRSRSMKREMGCCHYLPPGYEKDTERRYPVIYHLHGADGNETRSVYSASVLHEGTLAGKWPEIVMVFPNDGRSTMYQDSGEGHLVRVPHRVLEAQRIAAALFPRLGSLIGI